MITKNVFIEALMPAIMAYPWSSDAVKVATFTAKLRETMNTGRNLVAIDGPAFVNAWRAIGGKGKPTYKGLRALPDA